MDKGKAKRIRSLEVSIVALRDLNKSETLREEYKSANQILLDQYMDEVAFELVEEYQDSGKQFPRDYRIQ